MNENQNDFNMEDIYFKDAFTKTEDKLNLEVDNANIMCLTSKNNKFNLDEEGNLTVNNITCNSEASSLGVTIEDNLESTLTDTALSSNMGRVLNKEINDLKNSKNKILWSGVYYMSASQTANLSEAISAQKNGVVLIWSLYNNGASVNSDFNHQFIPKSFVTLPAGARGTSMRMTTSTGGTWGNKYCYINDKAISGYTSNNTGATTVNGSTRTNTAFVLRWVIGV